MIEYGYFPWKGQQVPGELRAEGNEHDGTDRRRGTTAISQASQLVAPARQSALAVIYIVRL